MLGRCRQSNFTLQRGRRAVLSESINFSPQPPGQRRQAHFSISPSLTMTTMPGSSSSGLGWRSMTCPTISGRRVTGETISRGEECLPTRPYPTRSRNGSVSHVPNRFDRCRSGSRDHAQPLGAGPASGRSGAHVAIPILQRSRKPVSPCSISSIARHAVAVVNVTTAGAGLPPPRT